MTNILIMKKGLIIIFRGIEESPKSRAFLNKTSAVSVSPGTWIVRTEAPALTFATELKKHLTSENEGFLVCPIMLSQALVYIQNYPEIADLFQS